jgi:glucose/arabinose dehydrogenase
MVNPYVGSLSQPTSIAFLPVETGQPVDLLVCEKGSGRVVHVRDGAIQGSALDLNVNSASERGLLGIAIHPSFDTNRFVYLYYTSSTTASDTQLSNQAADNRVERYTWNDGALVSASLILLLPVTPGPNHDGGILLFGPDDRLYGVIGDLNRNGQLENFPAGAPPDDTAIIFRINDDGTFPSNNPFFALGGAMRKVYAYGVRNCFGMDFDPVSNELWDTENGPSRYDEINQVLAGFNSGWEQIMGPDVRDDQNVSDLWMATGSQYSDPEFSWFQTIGVTSIHFLRGSVLGSHLANDLLIGDNNSGALYHFEPTPDRAALVMPTMELEDLVADTSSERDEFLFGSGFGVVTDIVSAHDGVYVSSLTLGSVLRISLSQTSDVESSLPKRTRLLAQPNPAFRVVSLRLMGKRFASDMLVRIYSSAGRHVRTLRGSSAGLEWDGSDTVGVPVSAGVYFIRVDTGSSADNLHTKLIRMR